MNGRALNVRALNVREAGQEATSIVVVGQATETDTAGAIAAVLGAVELDDGRTVVVAFASRTAIVSAEDRTAVVARVRRTVEVG